MTDYIYIDTKDKLNVACKIMAQSKELGIDIECENNLHYYGSYISIFQVSTKMQSWIIDVLVIDDLTPFLKLLEDKNIVKIFHDVNFDFQMIQMELNCKPKNIFDTRIACELLNKKHLGLGNLLEEYFQIKKEKKFQMADWTKRPLNSDLLSYAINDSKYLIKLKEILTKELIDLNRLDWANEEFKLLEQKNYALKPREYINIKNAKSLNPTSLGVLKELYDVREKLAKLVNRPTYFLIRDQMLISLADKPNYDINFWKSLTRVHPIVKKKANLFVNAVKKGLNKPLKHKIERGKRFNKYQQQNFDKLLLIRDEVSKKLGVEKHIFMSYDDAKKCAVVGDFSPLKNWQKEQLKLIEDQSITKLHKISAN